MKAILTTAALTLIQVLAVAAPGELHFQCPERYVSQPAELAEVPQGWQRSVAAVRPHLLISGGGMVSGSPKLYPPAELRGSGPTKTKDGWSETRFPVEGESWAFCSYGQGGEVQLFRRVDGIGAKECSVRTRRPKSHIDSPVVEVACR